GGENLWWTCGEAYSVVNDAARTSHKAHHLFPKLPGPPCVPTRTRRMPTARRVVNLTRSCGGDVIDGRKVGESWRVREMIAGLTRELRVRGRRRSTRPRIVDCYFATFTCTKSWSPGFSA